MESTQNSSILIIAGMHRSGTSLTASILQSAGLHIGRKLLDQSHGASERHFENLDFFEYHKAVLRSQGVNEDGWTLQETIEVDDHFVGQAKELIAKNAVSAVWGWKEPRTTLFLEFWANLLPEAKFLLLYRFPWEVVDSLYRRGDKIFKSQPDLAVKMWQHYNQKVLNIYNQFSDRCFLVNLHILLNHLDTVIPAINQKLQLNLTLPSSTLYNPSQIHKQSIEGHRASLIAHYFPEAIEMYRELEARAWQHNETPDFSWIEQLKNTPYRTWAFQDWLQLSNWEGEKSKLHQELESSRSQLQQTQAELEGSRSQLQQTQAELEGSRSQLQQTQGELEQSQSQLQQNQGELEQSHSQLQQTQAELEQSHSQLQQNQAELEQSHSQLQQNQAELEQSQFYLKETQTELEQSQSQLKQTKAELENSVSQLNQTHEELEQIQLDLQNTGSQLKQSKVEQKRSQSQLYQVQSELDQTQAQLQSTKLMLEQLQAQANQKENQLNKSLSRLEEKLQKSIAESQEQLQELTAKFKQEQEKLQSEWYQTKQQLKRSQSILFQTQAELEQSQQQLYQTQQEFSQLRLEQALTSSLDTEDQFDYRLLVWKAWSAYSVGNLTQMSQYLRKAMKIRPHSRSETILDWLNSFTQFSAEKGTQLDVKALTNLEEWKSLMHQVLKLKVLTGKTLVR
jgi:predicted  nucleic acid-binding Zn-ribbon protein